MYYRITMNSAIIALASRMVTIGRGGPSVNGAALMTYLFRPAVVLVLGLLVAACGGGGPSLPGSSPAPLPRPPRDLTIELTPLDEAVLRWDAPVPQPGFRAPVTGYAVYLESLDGQAPQRLGVTGATSYIFSGLVPDRTYVFHVRAVSRIGEGQASESEGVTVITAVPPLAPEPPGSLSAELTPNNEALLRWTAPAPVDGRAPVTGYVVYLELPGGGYEKLGETGSLSYVHPNLSPGERYVFTVRASSEAGLSQASASAFVDVPSVFDQVPEPPGNFTAELTLHNDALLQWTAPTPSTNRAPHTHFEVYRELPGGQTQKLGESRSLSYLHSGLQWGERYVFHVLAVSDVGSSRPSRSAILDVRPEPAVLPPVAPGGFTAVLTRDNDVQFEWTEPASDPNRAPVEGYLVYEVKPGGGVEVLNPESDANSEPDPVDALTYLHDPTPPLVPGQRYTYYVRATSAEGTSPPSASDFVEVPVDPIVPLSIPHVTVRADQEVDYKDVVVSWIHNLPLVLQSVVAGFHLQKCDVVPGHLTDHCQGGWRNITPPGDGAYFAPTTRTYSEKVTCDSTETMMTNARMYRVRAVANNSSLSSRYSVPTRPICPGAGYSPPRRVDAIFAAEPVAVPPEPLRVNICWEVPEDNDSPLLGYELQATIGPNLPATEDGWVIVDAHIDPEYDMTAETYVDPACRLYSGLVPNQNYWFRVRAYNLSGHGHWSAPYHYRHEGAVVPPLTTRASVESGSTLSLADARAREGTDATLTFEVTLDRPASTPVTVDYATANGTATAGEDYRAASGTLELAAGETSKTIEVAVHADTENEGEETLTLSLSNATGARIADGEATGTIQDHDPLPKEWLARFGRTVAGQVVDAVGTRLESKPGTHARVGGVPIESSAAPGALERLSRQWTEPAWNASDRPEETRSLSRRALMSGSSFHLSSEGGAPVFAAWGRFATEGFEADVHDTRLDGETTTGFLGADVEGGRWLMGAAVSHSEADGSFVPGSGAASSRGRSEVESTLSGVYPYARLTLSERVSLWGLAGVGQGTLTVSEAGRTPVDTDIGMNMGALGARGTMLSPSEAGGIALALRSDAFWVRMASDETRSETAGDLADIRTDASRVRLFLEAEREFAVRGEATLTPSFEVGVRHDGGDAETGTGFEAGAGMRYAAEGIAIEGAVRKLVTHEDSGYEEWGASGSVRIDPGASGRGLSLTLAPAFGAASSETERLWSLGDARRFSGDAETGAGSRLEAEVGYGWRLLSTTHGMLTPYTGLSFSDRGTRAWRLGARLMMTRDVSFGLEGTRRERSDDASDQAVVLHGRLHW